MVCIFCPSRYTPVIGVMRVHGYTVIMQSPSLLPLPVSSVYLTLLGDAEASALRRSRGLGHPQGYLLLLLSLCPVVFGYPSTMSPLFLRLDYGCRRTKLGCASPCKASSKKRGTRESARRNRAMWFTVCRYRGVATFSKGAHQEGLWLSDSHPAAERHCDPFSSTQSPGLGGVCVL